MRRLICLYGGGCSYSMSLRVLNGRSVVGHRSPLASQGRRVAYQLISPTRENEGMTCQVPIRIVSYRRYETARAENSKPRSDANARRISSSSIRNPRYHTISYSIHLSPSIYLYIYLIYTDPSGPGSERRLFLCLHQVPILAQTQQVSLQHCDRHLPHRGYVDRSLPRSIVHGGSVSTPRPTQ
jgi:hypothetical protein